MAGTEEPTEGGLAWWADNWRPEPVHAEETVQPEPSWALAALLDQDPPVHGPGDALPALWQWLHFLDRTPQAGLGDDGHPLHGGFVPAVPRRRRMFAGGRVEVRHPLRVGERVARDSRVCSLRHTTGRSGELLFVTVEHRFSVAGETRLVEEQDIVYRQAAEGSAPGAAASGPTGPKAAPAAERAPAESPPWQLELVPSATLLFRFSALTYNPHRIHYDHPYATQVEGYPGLVVHGPLLALGMLEPARRAGVRPRRFSFRLRAPLFCGEQVLFQGRHDSRRADLAAYGDRGRLAATAEADLA